MIVKPASLKTFNGPVFNINLTVQGLGFKGSEIVGSLHKSEP
jgi:hypothetical protein